MKIKKETKIEIIEINIESLNMKETEALITIDSESFELGMNHLLDMERYEDCCLMRDNRDSFVSDEKVVKRVLV